MNHIKKMDFLSKRVCEVFASSNETVTIPEEIMVYRQTYIDTSVSKPKKNRFERSVIAQAIPENATVITHQTVFLLDITGSMQSVIDSVKKEIVPVMQRLKDEATRAVSEIPNNDGQVFVLNFEVSVIGYRDFCDSKHFETYDFTSEIPEIEEFLKTLRADGGNDEPEDVKGAFVHALFGVSDKAMKLSWKTDTASKSVFLITDAPAHGNEFHSLASIGDNHSRDSADEWRMILNEMKKYNIAFNVIKINAKTTQMCGKFKSMCEIVELPYMEIDISQQITPIAERAFGAHPHAMREMSTLGGEVEAYMSTGYRMTSAGYASSSRAREHTDATVVAGYSEPSEADTV